jgi:intracellular septation protein A
MKSLRGSMFGLLPLAGFYLAYRFGTVMWAVAVGAILTLAIVPVERKATGSMRWCWIGLAGVAVGGILALVTNDPKLFFLRAVIGDAVFGLAMLGSLVIGKPLIATFASWVVNIPEEYKVTKAYRRSFTVLTLVWGIVNVARAAGRGYMLAAGTLEQFVLIQILTSWPVFAVLVAFSVWYPRRLARRHVADIGGDESMINQLLLGIEETYKLELAVGAEE